MKYLLGYHKENLWESFWDVQTVTIIHYGIPLFIIGLAAPIVLHVLFRGKDVRILCFFDSSLFFMFSFVFFFVRKLSNKTFCIAFLLAFAMTLPAIWFLRKNNIVYAREGGKKALYKALPVLVYWLVFVAIYTPNELYLSNSSDFPMSYWYFFGKLLLSGGIAFTILLAGMLIYLTKKQFELFLLFVFTLLTTGYIQGMFLNGNMGVLDGTQKAWGISKIILNLFVWLILIGAIIVFYVWKKETAQKAMQIVSIWLVLTQVVSLTVLIVTSEDTDQKSGMELTTEGMLEVGTENNIIVFVLDKFDGRFMDEVLEADAEFLSPLKDFTYYQNTTSEFSPTYNSIPYLLTGTIYEEGREAEYVSYAYTEDTLLTDLATAGYNIGLYTHKRYVSEDMQNIISNYEENVERTCSMWDLFFLMTQCSRYKIAPFIAKEYYLYDTSDIALLVVDEHIVNIENDIPFYHKLTDEGLRVINKDTNGVFRFIHMHGAHPPYTMTEEYQYLEYDARRDEHWGSGVSQARGAMKIVYEYIRQLKELGKYDDALIIITADHEYTEELSDGEGNMIDISFPILFVKEPYENREKMKDSQAPVSHADVIVTIKDTLGKNMSEKVLKEIDESEERIRFLKVSNPGSLKKYQINGNVRDLKNWEYLYETN